MDPTCQPLVTHGVISACVRACVHGLSILHCQYYIVLFIALCIIHSFVYYSYSVDALECCWCWCYHRTGRTGRRGFGCRCDAPPQQQQTVSSRARLCVRASVLGYMQARGAGVLGSNAQARMCECCWCWCYHRTGPEFEIETSQSLKPHLKNMVQWVSVRNFNFPLLPAT